MGGPGLLQVRCKSVMKCGRRSAGAQQVGRSTPCGRAWVTTGGTQECEVCGRGSRTGALSSSLLAFLAHPSASSSVPLLVSASLLACPSPFYCIWFLVALSPPAHPCIFSSFPFLVTPCLASPTPLGVRDTCWMAPSFWWSSWGGCFQRMQQTCSRCQVGSVAAI